MRFFLNTVDIFAKEELVRDGFVQAAAPSGTDAYHINRNALHRVLYLPVGRSKCLPLHDERLKEIQETFSMTGQKTFTMVSKRLQETRQHYKDKSFRNSSVVLMEDVKQLPPICDSLIFNANAVDPSGYNLYQLFDNAITPNLCDSNEQTDQTAGPS